LAPSGCSAGAATMARSAGGAARTATRGSIPGVLPQLWTRPRPRFLAASSVGCSGRLELRSHPSPEEGTKVLCVLVHISLYIFQVVSCVDARHA
jgi:hypothetical protein